MLRKGNSVFQGGKKNQLIKQNKYKRHKWLHNFLLHMVIDLLIDNRVIQMKLITHSINKKTSTPLALFYTSTQSFIKDIYQPAAKNNLLSAYLLHKNHLKECVGLTFPFYSM